MTYEEFQAGLAETPELLGTVLEKHEADAIKHLTDGKKMVVTTLDEYKTTTQKAIDEATKKNHSDWEAKIEKVTGQKRPEGKKGLEWFDELSAKIKYLDGEGVDHESPLYKGLKKELDDLKTERATEKKELFKAKVENQVTNAIKGLQFATPSHLKKDDDKASFLKQKAEDAADIFTARYTPSYDDQGRLIFSNKKGEAQTLNGEPMTADAIAARDFANELQPKGHSQGGAGSGGTDTPNPNGNADYLGATTEDIRTKLAEMMIPFGSDKWADLYTKAHLAAGYIKTEEGTYVKKS
ncbi:hypothetical protein [Spirosoma areae]